MKPVQLETLKTIPLFKDLPQSVMQTLAQTVKLGRFQEGQRIGQVGEQLNYLLAIVSGLVQSQQHHPERKALISSDHGPGSLIGLLSAIDGQPLSSTLVAKTPAEILLVPMKTVRDVLLKCPPVVTYLLTQMAGIIRKYEDERRMLTLPNAYQRIYFHILTLAQPDASGLPQAKLPNQNEIATLVNTSRETVSRAVQQLVKQGIIAKQGHRIQLVRPELLKRLVESNATTANSSGARTVNAQSSPRGDRATL